MRECEEAEVAGPHSGKGRATQKCIISESSLNIKIYKYRVKLQSAGQRMVQELSIQWSPEFTWG